MCLLTYTYVVKDALKADVYVLLGCVLRKIANFV